MCHAQVDLAVALLLFSLRDSSLCIAIVYLGGFIVLLQLLCTLKLEKSVGFRIPFSFNFVTGPCAQFFGLILTLSVGGLEF